jgi:hypothetical protein
MKIPKEEDDPQVMMRVEPPNPEPPVDSSQDLLLLIQAHKQLLKDTTKRPPHFRKHKNDMVMKQLKFVHESSLVDERRQFQSENENQRMTAGEPAGRRDKMDRLE